MTRMIQPETGVSSNEEISIRDNSISDKAEAFWIKATNTLQFQYKMKLFLMLRTVMDLIEWRDYFLITVRVTENCRALKNISLRMNWEKIIEKFIDLHFLKLSFKNSYPITIDKGLKRECKRERVDLGKVRGNQLSGLLF